MSHDLQRIDVKLLLDTPPRPDIDVFLVIFDRWRQRKDHPCDWVDLADYAHMPSGPGILIAGKRDRFSIDLNPPGPGLLTSTRAGLEGSLEDRIREAFRRARELSRDVMSEPEFPADFAVSAESWEIYINDRLAYPNSDASDALVRPALASALGAAPAAIVRHDDRSGRLGYSASAAQQQ